MILFLQYLCIPNFGKCIRLLIPILLLGISNQILGQDLDTWFMAGRGVNISAAPPGQVWQLSTPQLDGSPVTIWHDWADFVVPADKIQDAVPHPNPVDYPLLPPTGFGHSFGSPAYLDPIGSIPRVPTLARNAIDNINFNPIVKFDGSGNGEALHYRSVSIEETTVIVVFKAFGAGNSAETMRPLHGGDIDTHHSSTTNTTWGISDGNRFSVGRTWTGDGGGYYQRGGYDLLGEATIGVGMRSVTGAAQEALQTWVNGLPDINITRDHPRAADDLYLFNFLGKHPNSNDPNRNLTGDIAEVLIFDGPLSASARQKVESYLAIKYGITLNNSGGQLGSIVGNSTYDYITADGAVFWQAGHPYIYDIAGIGVDRFQDNAYPEDLRYHQDQRISKSSNPGARITISTGPDFTSDALEFAARPSIDGDGSSYEHNYLVWANDHGSINLTNTEIPPSISDRIGREWKVQITSSAAVSISNVSVRINLSGSDILNTCGIRLLIDTDGDGDFTTGTISEVLPTTIDGGGNSFFDGINFQDNDVFTVGYVDDIPPTASNPSPVTVCDAPPAPDPNIVTDEADNCGSATVTHLGDVSDG
ncbi:MAG: hypothetical protein AB3N10_13095, partial [Allomuricauda sp.]